MHFIHIFISISGGRIDSEYNKKIVNLVAAEFEKDQCPIATVKGMSSCISAHYFFTKMSYSGFSNLQANTEESSDLRRFSSSACQAIPPTACRLACLHVT